MKRVDAIVLIGSSFNEVNSGDNQYIIEASKQVPIIWINSYLEADNIYGVYCDDMEGTYRAAKYLFQTNLDGKRAIYLYNRESFSNKSKIKGFLQAMLEADQPIFENSITLCPLSDVDMVMEKIMKTSNNLENIAAIITDGDRLAVRILKYLRKHGIAVPERIQLIGYSNSDYGQYSFPELTSVDSRVDELSKEAVNMLLKILNGEDGVKTKRLTAKIVPRESTKSSYKEVYGRLEQEENV